MKLKNIKEVEEFRKVIHTCTGDVYLKSQDGDVFNLKSALSEYIALGQLRSEQGDTGSDVQLGAACCSPWSWGSVPRRSSCAMEPFVRQPS